MNTVIGTGRTIEQAIENALSELNATQDQVTIKVISEGGFFKKAQVEVTLDEVEKKSPIVSFDEVESDVETDEIKEEANEEKLEERIKPINKKGKKQLVTKAVEEPKKEEKAQLKETKKDLVEDKTLQTILENTIKEILKFSKGEGIELNFEFESRAVNVTISGSKLGALIGTGGETLNGLESYLNAICLKSGSNKRVRLDIGGYKKEKEQKLIALAEKAYQIAFTRGSYKFDPMPARERRIIHTALQNKEDVTTFSKGTEPKRFVIVEKKSN